MSDFPKDSPYHSDQNKKVSGVFKVEGAKMGRIREMVCLRPKVYAIKYEEKSKNGRLHELKCKGGSKSYLYHGEDATFAAYKNVYENQSTLTREVRRIGHKVHDLSTEIGTKKFFDWCDDKVFIREDKTSTYNHGHTLIPQSTPEQLDARKKARFL